MTDRQRHGLILLLVAGLIAASAVIISQFQTRLGLDLKGGVELIYQGEPTPQTPRVTSDALNRAVQIMQNRVNQLGVSQPLIQTYGANGIDVQLPDVKNTLLAEKQVGTTARLEFYDWEANVLTPNGQTVESQLAAQDQAALLISQGPPPPSPWPTGSVGAGALPLYQAVQLAAQRPERVSPDNARLGNEYYLFGAPGSSACQTAATDAGRPVDQHVHCLLAGPVTLSAAAPMSDVRAQLSQGLPPGVTFDEGELLTVKQGTVVLQAVPLHFSHWPAFGSPLAGYYVLKDHVGLFGNEITNPQQSTDQVGAPDVSFGLTSQGGSAFQRITARIANRGQINSLGASQLNQHFAVALDNQLVTVPSIDFRIYPDGISGGGGADITGGFTIDSAQQLATELRLGALPIRLRLISEQAVSATLGKQALHQGLVAGLVGLLVVALFLLVFYRMLGVIAIAGLIVYGIYFYALIKLIPITMTLAGIAGLILTIGVAADANIVIFERVKEEIRGGRSIRQGIVTGYRKGLTAIIDANVVTIMTAFILFVLATEDVKGFAFTLGIGTFVSLFTAVLATQAILMTMGNSRLIASPAALGIRAKRRVWRFDFMGASRYFFSMSGVILLVGALAIGGRGLNLGIDFTSGTRISVGLQHPATVSQIRSVMAGAGAGDATVQQVNGSKTLGRYGFQISSKYLDKTRLDQVQLQLQNRFGIAGNGNDINKQSIGPTFGSQVAHSAVIAIIASLLVISCYVALRFDWKFAVPVLIALMHDLLITSGVYALTGRTVTTDTVAALLTILGYSMYDTIIVFDRVRENIPRMPRAAFSQIVNRSMSEVLTRSLATTTCTLLPVLALLLFGGTTLKDFAFALLIGVASGAYSSIFIASPVLTHWKEREPHYRARRTHIEAELGAVPAYADRAADVEPVQKRAPRIGRITEPDAETVSAAEFEEMKRELGIEEEPVTRHTSTLSKRLSHSREDELAPSGPARRTARQSKAAGGVSTGAKGDGSTNAADGSPTPPQRTKPSAPAGTKSSVPAGTKPPGRGATDVSSVPAVPPEAEPTEVVPAPDVPENEGMVQAPKPKRQKSRPRNRRHGRR
jgi:SecD/SecF fusion protein